MSDPVQAFRLAVLHALGHAPEVIEPGKLHRFGTSDRRGDDAGWCKFFKDQRGGVFGCYRSGLSETWTADRPEAMSREQRAAQARQIEAAKRERAAEQRRQWDENAERIARLWSQCVPLVPGDLVTRYLQARGLDGVTPLPGVLRMHRSLPYWQGAEKIGMYPAMVAPIVAPDGRPVALHRTYLTERGTKADAPSPKKLTPACGPLSGACIPLHQPSRGVIGIAEGIETALAAWRASGVPTVAAYCAGNLSAWEWPSTVRRIVIFADHDRAGLEAADTLRARVLAARLQCEVMTPTTEGADWCDVWAERGAVLVESGSAA